MILRQMLPMVALLAGLVAVTGAPGHFDETMWTRSTFPEYKLDWPVGKLFSLVRHSPEWNLPGEWLSALGPNPRDFIKQALQRAAREPAPSKKARLVLHVAAADAIKCEMCNSLVETVWHEQVSNLHMHVYTKRSNPDAEFHLHDPEAVLQQACDTVPEDILARFKVEQVLTAIEPSPGQTGPMQLRLFTLQPRDLLDAPNDGELDAAQRLCKSMVKTLLGPDASDTILKATREYARLYMDAWTEFGSVHPDKNKTPPVHPGCADFHVMCDMWAKAGECEKNPKYMVGTSETGQCRMSCRACSHPANYPWQLLPDDVVKALQQHIAQELARLQDLICEAACQHPTSKGRALTGTPVLPMRPENELLDTLMAVLDTLTPTQVPLPSERARAEGPQPPVDAHDSAGATPGPPPASTPPTDALVLVPNEAQLVPRRLAAPDLQGRQPVRLPHSVSPSVAQAVDAALLNSCVLLPQGWWVYELCYGLRLRQYHVEERGITQHNVMGYFKGAASSAPPAGMKQIYVDGDECGGEITVQQRRRAEVVYACAPDGRVRMEIHEPRVCQYLVSVYLPHLCTLAPPRSAASGGAQRVDGEGGGPMAEGRGGGDEDDEYDDDEYE